MDMNKSGENHRFHFLKTFLRNPLQVGAITPSSEKLAEAMLADLNLKPDELILELGPGTGAFTGYIRRIIPDTRLYCGIECEPRFVKILKSNYPDMRFVNGRAEQADELSRNLGLPPVKVIISGIPFANHWEDETQNSIIDTLDILMRPGAIFRTFQYVHAFTLPPAKRFRNMMNARFGNYQRSRMVLKNLPPAFVLTWQK